MDVEVMENLPLEDEDVRPINPFAFDDTGELQGKSLARNFTLMHPKRDDNGDIEYVIVVNRNTGERVKVIL